MPFIKPVTPFALFSTPKKAALAVTLLLHAPLLLVTVKWPEYNRPLPLKAVEVGLGLQQALEVALLKQNGTWDLKTFGLPPLLTLEEPPNILYSSYILVDSLDGSLIWAKPHPLFDDYLTRLKFEPATSGPRLLSGYISTSMKE